MEANAAATAPETLARDLEDGLIAEHRGAAGCHTSRLFFLVGRVGAPRVIEAWRRPRRYGAFDDRAVARTAAGRTDQPLRAPAVLLLRFAPAGASNAPRSGRVRASAALLLLLWLAGLAGPARGADAEPFSSTAAQDLRRTITSIDTRITVLASSAILRFDPESEAWSLIGQEEGLPAPPYRNLTTAGEQVWVAGEGAAFSTIRFDGWRSYTGADVPWGSALADIEADDDYAYSGGERGAARFDQYVMEWEEISGPADSSLGAVRDVAVGEDRVWFGLRRGVAEYRKDTQSLRVDSLLGAFRAPEILSLAQTSRFLWALTDRGLARYDRDLRSWSSFAAGRELPDARVRSWLVQGEDVWLGTDAGLWRYQADAGLWRRHPAMEEMPGSRVTAFALGSSRIWVTTEKAFALYDEEEARWIDFTPAVPVRPEEVREMALLGQNLVYVTRSRVVCGLPRGQSNPSLYTYRERSVPAEELAAPAARPRWSAEMDAAGAGVRFPDGSSLHLKGGATIYLEDDDLGRSNRAGLDKLDLTERLDLALNGRLPGERSVNGYYDTTDPDNSRYRLTYRGRDRDNVRQAAFGELEQDLYNSALVPGAGIRGGTVRLEAGPRSAKSGRRLVTTDAWMGRRITRPRRDVFRGGSRTVELRLRDTDYLRRRVYAPPGGWPARELPQTILYRDDADAATNDANTESRSLAGIFGAWDRLNAVIDYFIDPGSGRLVLTRSLGAEERLVLVRTSGDPAGREADLTERWEKNHYLIGTDAVAGSLSLALLDSTGAAAGPSGTPYLRTFLLDRDGDGALDPDRFHTGTGLLAFPDSLPFPDEVYVDPSRSFYTMSISFQTARNTFRLANDRVIPGSERITVDRELLRPDVDYSIIPSSGLFVFFEHVLLDDDSAIEVEYTYEVDEEAGGEENLVSGQIGFAPAGFAFAGINGTRWTDEAGRESQIADFNTRLEWRAENSFLRVSPEAAWSRAGGRDAWAGGAALQARLRSLELTGTRRKLESGFTSFEDRHTLLGTLREETQVTGRWTPGPRLQAEVDWNEAQSDSAAGPVSAPGGTESSLSGTLRILRSGLPNIAWRRGRVLTETSSERREKWIHRLELEISPDQAGVSSRLLRALQLRSFFQRSERQGGTGGTEPPEAAEPAGDLTVDRIFTRLTGAAGTRLSWNAAFDGERTFLSRAGRRLEPKNRQSADLTLQTRPHSSLDVFFRLESGRDRFRAEDNRAIGHQGRRTWSGTGQLYPGRLLPRLTPLSFRVELTGNETALGEASDPFPAARTLWMGPADASTRRVGRNAVVESRVQIRPWLRWVEHAERRSEEEIRRPLARRQETRILETRAEAERPGGLVTVRLIGEESSALEERRQRRIAGQWDQTWGRGFLTYFACDGKREKTWLGNRSGRVDQWVPELRFTWRRSVWQTDASLGGSVNWRRARDLSTGAAAATETRVERSMIASGSVQPVRVLTLKLRYSWSLVTEEPIGGSSEGRRTDHDVRITLLLRA